MQLTSTKPAAKTTVLAVDDNKTALRLIESMLEREKYRVVTAVDGIDALRVMEEFGEEVDIILLDRMMPRMDGIAFCLKMKADPRFRLVPIIMQTAAGEPQEIKEGIEAGVFYYLVKPLVRETLSSIVEAARVKIHRYRVQRKRFLERQESMTMVQALQCSFTNLEEGEKLAVFLSQFFPEPDRVFTGVAELFINAVEHGNLGICYDAKGRLLEESMLQEEIDIRLNLPENREKRVEVSFEKKDDGYYLHITDEGEGFDWEKYLLVDPARATHNHGRGIAMANLMSFDKLSYHGKGNKVTGMIYA